MLVIEAFNCWRIAFDIFLLIWTPIWVRYYKMTTKKCLNVRQKLGTWKFFNVFLRFPMFSIVFQCYLLSLSLTISLSHNLTLSHSHNLSISHSITLDMLNNFCFHLYAQKSLFIAKMALGFSLTSMVFFDKTLWTAPFPVSLRF